MDRTEDNSGQGGRSVGRLERRSQESRWGELLDSTGWGRPASQEPRIRRVTSASPEAEAAPLSPLADGPAESEIVSATGESPLNEEAPALAAEETLAVEGLALESPLSPEPETPIKAIVEDVNTVIPLEAAERPAVISPPLPKVRAGSEGRPPASNAGLFDDWAKLEGAGWAGVPRSTNRPSPAIEMAVTASPPVTLEAPVMVPVPTPAPLPTVRRRPIQELDDLRDKVKVARETLRLCQGEIEAAQETLRRHQAEIEAAQAAVREHRSEIETAEETLRRRQTEIESSEATLRARQGEIEVVETALRTSQADLEVLEARRGALTVDVAALENRVFHERGLLVSLEQEQTEVGTALAAAAAMAAGLRDEVIALGSELADRQARVAAFEVQLGGLAAQTAVTEDRTTRDRQALNGLADERISLERELEVLAADRELRSNAIAALERQQREIANALDVTRVTLSREREALAHVAEDKIAVYGQRDEAAAARADLINDLSALEAEQTQRQRALAAAATDLAERQERINALDSERQALIIAAEAARTAAKAEEQALAALRNEIIAQNQALRERDLVLEEVTGLKRQLEALRAERVQAQEERVRAVQDLQDRRIEFQTVYNRDKQLLNKIQREIAGAQKELERLNGL